MDITTSYPNRQTFQFSTKQYFSEKLSLQLIQFKLVKHNAFDVISPYRKLRLPDPGNTSYPPSKVFTFSSEHSMVYFFGSIKPLSHKAYHNDVKPPLHLSTQPKRKIALVRSAAHDSA